MKKQETFLTEYTPDYPIERLGNPMDILFFDIETTGFTAKTANLYMIGCVWHNGESYVVTQFLAENYESEKNILSAFITFASTFKVIVHFNGNNFDIPFILDKCKQYGYANPFEHFEGVDLYRRINPYKDLLRLPNCKQKTIEEFLGLNRQDKFTGGDLIGVYKEYVNDQDSMKERDLFLHNHDDLVGMLSILPMLTYFDMFSGHLSVVAAQANTYTGVDGSERKELLMTAKLESKLPAPISGVSNGCYFSAKDDEAAIKVPIIEKELKYFYSNYKEYYYLPEEDLALHKSVASFVDPAHRKAATQATCYTRKYSSYIPEWSPVISPFFKEEYNSKDLYFELTDEIKKDRKLFNNYASHILMFIGLGKIQ